MSFPKIFTELVAAFAKFPGVGRRSAERMVFYLLKSPPLFAKDLAYKIEDLHNHIKPCSMCNNFSSHDVCHICADPRRDKDIICVVEEPKDVIAIEKTSSYKGLYYVLLSAVSSLEDGEAPELNITRLLKRLESGEIKEVIISTDPDNDGELTAQFLIEKISPYKVKIYRIAIGIPLGTQIEYIDSATLGKALLERKQVCQN